MKLTIDPKGMSKSFTTTAASVAAFDADDAGAPSALGTINSDPFRARRQEGHAAISGG